MANDFLFHKISEKEKQEIKDQAKKIMDSFSKKLSQIKENIAEPLIERENGERNEGETPQNKIDRDIIFQNAPTKNKDFIIAEKGGW
jgi:Asp-tRNA(Asn)/Glu-tRNA(Gln) amidotransferase C subunit